MTHFSSLIIILFALVIGACTGTPAPPSDAAAPPSGPRKVAAADLRLDASNSTAVISSAQKFIIPVPALSGGGEPLRYPAGHEKAGEPILDFEGKPIGGRGLIFFNDKDKTVQAVAGDGEGVIIINEVTQEQAERVTRKVAEFNSDPNALTLGQLKAILEFARADLNLGDMYNSTRSFVRSRMTPVSTTAAGTSGPASSDYGLKKRDDRDICYAVYIPGAFVFQGPAATPQVFDNGGVIVAQGGELRGVQTDVFLRTYRFADGRTIGSATADLTVWAQDARQSKP